MRFKVNFLLFADDLNSYKVIRNVTDCEKLQGGLKYMNGVQL